MIEEKTFSPEKSNRGNMSLRRKSAARLALVQCLYEVTMNKDTPLDPDLLAARYKEQWAHGQHLGDVGKNEIEPDYKFLTKLLAGMRDARELIQPVRVKLLAEAWNKDRLPPLMEALFDAALFEMHAAKLGAKLVVDEYVRLAKRFFEENEVNFVNGVLHRAGGELGQLPKAATPDADE